LNASPVQPQLTEDNFFILRESGPTATGYNEFSPLFTADGVTFQVDMVGGDLNTWGDQVTISGVEQKVAFALSQLAYATDGIRANDDFDKRLVSGFLQFEPDVDTSFQTEFSHSESEFGDPLLAFDPDLVIDDRHELRNSRARVGMRQSTGINSELIVSASASEQHELVHSFGVLAIKQDTRTYFLEARHVLKRGSFNLTTGVGYDSERQDTDFFGSPFRFEPYAANAYAYLNISPRDMPFIAHLGASIDHLADKDDLTKSRTKVNPKLGVTWTPWSGATLRAAAFRALGRQFAISESVEPTQVAGFNQFYDDLAATESRRTAISFDQSVGDSVFFGAEWSRRDMTVPQDLTGEVFH